MENNNDNRLHELSGSGYEMADGEPDIRGWETKNLQGQTTGKVNELIFDKQSNKVRYLVVNIKGKPFNITSRKVLVPIGLAELHEENDDVVLPNVTPGQFATLPEYRKNEISADTERKIRNVFSGRENAAILSDDMFSDNTEEFYNHEHFDENRMYSNRKRKPEDETTIPVIEENINVGKRIVETGGVHVSKNIVEEPVQETVQLKEERVTVDRKKVDKPVQKDNFAAFEESTIELTEHAEIPVVAKEARVVEEISVNKEVAHRDETIHDTVRKTEVAVEELNKNDSSHPNK